MKSLDLHDPSKIKPNPRANVYWRGKRWAWFLVVTHGPAFFHRTRKPIYRPDRTGD